MPTFGPYELVQRLGIGGMGEVFLARLTRQDDFEKLLVIKRILPQLSSDSSFRELFRREARLAALLSHQNIVQIFDYGEVDGQSFIAMEYVEGSDVASLLRFKAPLERQFALAIIQGALRGLDYAHRKTDSDGRALGLVHRDVAPKNLLVSDEGEVKWIDFGLANALRGESGDGLIGGTVGYMAPEQAVGKHIDATADLFAVGAMAFELLTGRCPFANAGEDVDAHVKNVMDQNYPMPSDLGLSPEFDVFLCRALAPDPTERFGSAREMLAAMSELTRKTVIAAPFELGEFVANALTAKNPSNMPPTQTSVGDAPARAQARTLVGEAPVGGIGEPSDVPGEPPDASEEPAGALAAPTTAPADSPVTADGDGQSDVEPEPATVPVASAPRWPLGLIIGLVLLTIAVASAAWFLGTDGGSQSTRETPVEPGTWALSIDSDPTGAMVSLAGKELGTTPLRLEQIEPTDGNAELEIALDGYESWRQSISLGSQGGALERSVQLLEETAFLSVSVTPVDATLSINDAVVESRDGPYVVSPGTVVVLASAKGHDDKTEVVQLASGETASVAIALRPQNAELQVSVTPVGASVSLSGRAGGAERTCQAPCLFSNLVPGSYQVSATADGHTPASEVVELRPGAKDTLALDCPSVAQKAVGAIAAQSVGGRLQRGGASKSRLVFDAGGFVFRGDGMKATVALEASKGGWLLSIRTDPWSRFAVGGRIFESPLTYHRLPAGRFKVRMLDAAGQPRKLGFNLDLKAP